MSIEIIFETHSTSTDNEAGIATGWLPGELSELGKRQAAELGERRRRDALSGVYTSDLTRAVQTAEIAFGASGVPVCVDERLRECNYGALNGGSRDLVHSLRARHIDEPFPEGESYRQAVGRVRSFLNDLPTALDGSRIVVIGHLATLWSLEVLLNGRDLVDLASRAAGQFDWQPGWYYTLAR